MKLVESTWRVYGSGAYRGVTLTHRADPPAREAWIVRWAVGEGDWRQWSGEDPVAVLRYAADQAPGIYRDAILAAAANPPSVPVGSTLGDSPAVDPGALALAHERVMRIIDDATHLSIELSRISARG